MQEQNLGTFFQGFCLSFCICLCHVTAKNILQMNQHYDSTTLITLSIIQEQQAQLMAMMIMSSMMSCYSHRYCMFRHIHYIILTITLENIWTYIGDCFIFHCVLCWVSNLSWPVRFCTFSIHICICMWLIRLVEGKSMWPVIVYMLTQIRSFCLKSSEVSKNKAVSSLITVQYF